MLKKRLKQIVISVMVLTVLGYCCLAIYATDYYHADDTVISKLCETDYLAADGVQMEITDDMIIFQPDEIKAGFVFYPGGKVEYTAYVPLIYKLAQNGVACIITEMPFNLAVMDINAADKATEKIADIDNWYIGGHSLGGSMAASYIAKNNNSFDGLVLLASYSTADLTDSDISVLSVYGTEDKVLSMEKYDKNYSNLPVDTTEVIIEGGNHAQFGCYGAQDGDGTAIISDIMQCDITVDAITELMGISTK